MRRLALVPALVLAACGTPAAKSTRVDTSATPIREASDPTEGVDEVLARATTTTARPSRSRSRPRVIASATAGTANPDIWHALAMCESGMRQDAVGEGVHYSYFQWKLATWWSVKAPEDPADPRDASYEAQVAAAKRLQARSGWGQWPACSRKLGLR